ncbi:MAG: hypothetical protein AB2748_18310 [Candidatus Thiodiazotropha endolucinida]
MKEATNTEPGAISVADEAEEVIEAVLGTRQVGYISDVTNIFNQWPQTTWRQYSANPPRFPRPFYNGDRRSWTRPTLKGELVRRMTNTKAA